ncbi:MAG: sulfite exporter TauE/SafE family protein [Spirochaetales bacterium]|nr:sulfite exporter TauE/SafE family protein [Spirochaetales bacterium]
MSSEIVFLNMNLFQLISIAVFALLAGFERAGIRSAVLPVVPFVVKSFGAVNALGYMIPLLIAGDIFSVSYYRKNAEKKELIRLLPFAAAGIIFAMIIGGKISADTFKKTIGTLIILSLIIIFLDQKISNKNPAGRNYRKTGPLFSISTGFSSMLGGSGGAIISTYFLLTGINKNAFIGTTAWFFFFVNLFKLPLYYFGWKNIHPYSLLADLMLMPLLAAGILTGIFIIKKINEKMFRIFIFIATFLSALILFI